MADTATSEEEKRGQQGTMQQPDSPPSAEGGQPAAASSSSRKGRDKDARDAWQKIAADPIANLNCTSSCITFADVVQAGENKVVIANMNFEEGKSELKIFSGGEMQQTFRLFGYPCGVISFRTAAEAQTPAIAVASGNALYVFKNLRPFYKFVLPDLALDEQELETWLSVRNAKEDVDADVLVQALQSQRASGVKLSPRSLTLLTLAPEKRAEFVAKIKELPATTPAVITCVSVLPKISTEENAVACPVLGTEDGQVFVLSPTNLAGIVRLKLPEKIRDRAVSCIATSGALDVDYRIHICTRDGTVCSVKGGKVSDATFTLPAPAVGIDRVGKSLLISCSDNCLYCFSTKGRRLWQSKMPSPITAHSPMVYRPKMIRASLVGLESGEVRIYSDKELLTSLNVGGGLAALRFGRLWRDSHVLVAVTLDGKYAVHQLRRGAAFHDAKATQGPPPEQHIRIKVPTKTKLYVDQTQREKDNAVSMHQAFRRDHYILQVLVARKYVKAMASALAPTSALEDVNLQVGAAVQGIGPSFRLVVNIQNTSDKPACSVRVALTWDEGMYDVAEPSAFLPHLVPGVAYSRAFSIQCIAQEMVSSPLRVQLYSPERSLPIVTAVVAMPVSEPVITVR